MYSDLSCGKGILTDITNEMAIKKDENRRRGHERFPRVQRHSKPFKGLPSPTSRQDLGEIAPRVRASMVIAEGRRSFAFL